MAYSTDTLSVMTEAACAASESRGFPLDENRVRTNIGSHLPKRNGGIVLSEITPEIVASAVKRMVDADPSYLRWNATGRTKEKSPLQRLKEANAKIHGG